MDFQTLSEANAHIHKSQVMIHDTNKHLTSAFEYKLTLTNDKLASIFSLFFLRCQIC